MSVWLGVASLNLATAVAFGAFGAHGLKNKVSDIQLTWWFTATEYFFYHAFGLLVVALLMKLTMYKLQTSAWFFQIGIIVFCGSLYLMALGAPRFLGAITPIGGLLFILGWLVLAYQAFTKVTLT